jgi:hypothetical protein
MEEYYIRQNSWWRRQVIWIEESTSIFFISIGCLIMQVGIYVRWTDRRHAVGHGTQVWGTGLRIEKADKPSILILTHACVYMNNGSIGASLVDVGRARALLLGPCTTYLASYISSHVLPSFINIRCFSFMKQMYLDKLARWPSQVWGISFITLNMSMK